MRRAIGTTYRQDIGRYADRDAHWLSCSEHVIVLSDIDGDKISGGQTSTDYVFLRRGVLRLNSAPVGFKKCELVANAIWLLLRLSVAG